MATIRSMVVNIVAKLAGLCGIRAQGANADDRAASIPGQQDHMS